METECFLRCIMKGVSIIAGIVEYDFFYYTDVFVFLYSFDKEICCRRTKRSENFKVLNYKKYNRLWDQRKHNDFRWTDDEIQLLLQTSLEYKTKDEYKGFSWASIRNKYKNIREILVESYPRDEVDKEKISKC